VLAGTASLPVTHPVAGAVCGVVLLAQTIALPSPRRWQDKWLLLCAAVVLAGAVAAAWPLYPFFAVIGLRESYDEANAEMYVDVWRRVWPVAILAAPCLVMPFARSVRGALVLASILLATIYLFGALTQQYGYGRVISYLAIALQMVVAHEFVNATAIRGHRGRTVYRVAVAVVLLVCVALNVPDAVRRMAHPTNLAADYLFLRLHVGDRDVVLSDLESSYPIPSFAGRVVAHEGMMSFVPDAPARRAAVEQFFSDETSTAQRLGIAREYHVRWVLVSRAHAHWAAVAESSRSWGRLVYSDNKWMLFDLGPFSS
jgi:hypothetical protein